MTERVQMNHGIITTASKLLMDKVKKDQRLQYIAQHETEDGKCSDIVWVLRAKRSRLFFWKEPEAILEPREAFGKEVHRIVGLKNGVYSKFPDGKAEIY